MTKFRRQYSQNNVANIKIYFRFIWSIIFVPMLPNSEMQTSVQIHKLIILYHLLTVKCTVNVRFISDYTLWMIDLTYCVWSAVAYRCFPKEITDLALTNANNDTISQQQLKKGLEFVSYVRITVFSVGLTSKMTISRRYPAPDWSKRGRELAKVGCFVSCRSVTLQRHDMLCYALASDTTAHLDKSR